MSRRRFTTEELEEMAAQDRLSRAAKRGLFHEVGACISRGILLFVCIFKRTDHENDTPEARLVTAKEFARITTLSEKTIYRDARMGKLKCVRQGRRVMFPIEELDRYRIMRRIRGSPHLPFNDSKIH